jgi:hypothetical protein
MARVTHVKRAQQRYRTKPVLDENGEQKQTPVMNSRGEQKTTKGGRPVFFRITERDLEHPLPLLRCDHCGKDIELGTPYKWIQPHGRGQMSRHAGCPTWNVWEYSNSLSARIAQIQAGDPDSPESPEDITSWLEEKAGEIRELAEEKRESASNIEDGFGHATYQSDELNDIAEQLDSWADEVEQAEVPDFPEPEDEDCEECGGSGSIELPEDADPELDSDVCPECGGGGQVTADEPTEEQLDEWREAAIEAAREALDNCPV